MPLLNVIDVEATCWEGEPPPGQRSEIIEIGVCVLDLGTLERVEKRSLLGVTTRIDTGGEIGITRPGQRI